MTPTKKYRSVQSTVYPLDYNKNNPMKGFNKWALFIAEENFLMQHGKYMEYRVKELVRL